MKMEKKRTKQANHTQDAGAGSCVRVWREMIGCVSLLTVFMGTNKHAEIETFPTTSVLLKLTSIHFMFFSAVNLREMIFTQTSIIWEKCSCVFLREMPLWFMLTYQNRYCCHLNPTLLTLNLGVFSLPALQTIEFDEGAGAVLRIQPLRAPRDENIYECVAENTEGEITVNAKLSIIRGEFCFVKPSAEREKKKIHQKSTSELVPVMTSRLGDFSCCKAHRLGRGSFSWWWCSTVNSGLSYMGKKKNHLWKFKWRANFTCPRWWNQWMWLLCVKKHAHNALCTL